MIGSAFCMPADLAFHCSSCSSEAGLLAGMDYFPVRKSLLKKIIKRKKRKEIIYFVQSCQQRHCKISKFQISIILSLFFPFLSF